MLRQHHHKGQCHFVHKDLAPGDMCEIRQLQMPTPGSVWHFRLGTLRGKQCQMI